MASSQKQSPGTKDDPSQSNNPANNKPGDKKIKDNVKTSESKTNITTAPIKAPEVVRAATIRPSNSTTKVNPPKTAGRPPNEQLSRKLSIVSQQNLGPTIVESGGPAKLEKGKKISTIDSNATKKAQNKDANQKPPTVSQENTGRQSFSSGGPAKVEQGRRVTYAGPYMIPKTENKDAPQNRGSVSQENTGQPTSVSGGPAKGEQGRRATLSGPYMIPKTENKDAPQKRASMSQENTGQPTFVSGGPGKGEQGRRATLAGPYITPKTENKGAPQKRASMSQENTRQPTFVSGGPAKGEQGRRTTSAGPYMIPKMESKDAPQKRASMSQENTGQSNFVSGGPGKGEQGRRATSAGPYMIPKTDNKEEPQKRASVSQQNTAPTNVVKEGPVKEEQVARMSTRDPYTTMASRSASTVTLPPSGPRLSTPRTTRFELTSSAYDLTNMKMPTAPGGGSLSGSTVTVTANRPGILKRTSSSAPPVVGAGQSLPMVSGMAAQQLNDIPGSATSSMTSLRSASTRTLINRRSRERMLKRIERIGPRLMDSYSPSGSISVPPELQDKNPEISRRRGMSLTGSAESRRTSADSDRSRSSKSYVSNPPSAGSRSSNFGGKDTGGLRLKELVYNDPISKPMIQVESKSSALSTRDLKLEGTKPIIVASSSHGAFTVRKSIASLAREPKSEDTTPIIITSSPHSIFSAKRSDSVMLCQNGSSETPSDDSSPRSTSDYKLNSNVNVNSLSIRDHHSIGTKEIQRVPSLQSPPTVRRGSMSHPLKGTAEQKGSTPDRCVVREITKRKEPDKGSRSNSLTAIRRCSNVSSTMKSLNETPNSNRKDDRKSLSQDSRNKSNEALNRRKQSVRKVQDILSQSRSASNEGVYVDGGATERRSSSVFKSISQNSRQSLSSSKAGSYSSEHKINKSIPSLQSSRRSSAGLLQLSRIPEIETNRGADDSEAPLLPNFNRKMHEISNKLNTLRRTEVSRSNTEVKSSPRRFSELSNLAASTIRRLSNPGEIVDTSRRPSLARKSSFSEPHKPSETVLLPNITTILESVRRDSDTSTRINNKKTIKKEDKDQHK